VITSSFVFDCLHTLPQKRISAAVLISKSLSSLFISMDTSLKDVGKPLEVRVAKAWASQELRSFLGFLCCV
jgi:hypothetical protein